MKRSKENEDDKERRGEKGNNEEGPIFPLGTNAETVTACTMRRVKSNLFNVR